MTFFFPEEPMEYAMERGWCPYCPLPKVRYDKMIAVDIECPPAAPNYNILSQGLKQ